MHSQARHLLLFCMVQNAQLYADSCMLLHAQAPHHYQQHDAYPQGTLDIDLFVAQQTQALLHSKLAAQGRSPALTGRSHTRDAGDMGACCACAPGISVETCGDQLSLQRIKA